MTASACKSLPARRAGGRDAFTLVELLVVILIIALLFALLVPAVQGAREAARTMQCRNNLKQLGQALGTYEHAFKRFTPATEWDGSSGTPWSRPNWVTLLLPRLDQQPLFDSLDATKSIADPANRAFRGTRLQVMLCPSDPNNQVPFNGSRYFGMNDNWARGNYGGNGSLGGLGAGAWAPAQKTMRGIMGPGTAATADMVSDGLSNTFMLLELRSGLEEIDVRGTWAMGDSASSIWQAGSTNWNEVGGPWGQWPGSDCNGPNPANAFRMDQDNMVGCRDIFNGPLRDVYFQLELMGCWPDHSGNYNGQSAVRSKHRGGVMVCMADGSVQWISDYIDTNGRVSQGPSRYSVWDRLMASADGQHVSGDAF